MFSDYCEHDGLGLAELIRQKKIKASEALQAAQARCDAVNEKLNAVIMRHDALAQKTADDLDAQASNGAAAHAPFLGVPFLIKDLYLQLAGTRSTQGSRVFAQSPPAEEDAWLTEAYKKAGLMIFGKTNSPEFGLTGVTEPQLYGPTRNPWDLTRSPGGSSGGAAAAVAAGIVPLAHASDGGGSIRIPASACGLVGLKPSRGRISQGPLRSEGWAGMSINHVVSRSVRDCAAALDVSSALKPGEPYAAPAPKGAFLDSLKEALPGLRIAMQSSRPDKKPPHPDCTAALEHMRSLLTAHKHEVRDAEFDLPYDEMLAHQSNLISANMAFAKKEIERLMPAMPTDLFETSTKQSMERGRSVHAMDYVAGVNFIHALARRMGAFLTEYDLYVTPTLGSPPVEIGHISMMDENMSEQMARWRAYCPYTAIANMTGQPAISLPLYRNQDGLPIGVMVHARYGEEALLLQLAAQLEQAEPWPRLAPLAP